MSGRISVDDRAFDGAARRLRSAQSGLSGLQGQLNGGLAAGAPPDVAAQVRSAVGAARGAVAGVQGSLGTQSAELSRRAALTRLANGDGTDGDYSMLRRLGPRSAHGPGPSVADVLRALGNTGLIIPDWTPGAQPIPVKDILGGTEKLLRKWAAIWNTHTFYRRSGVKDLGISRRKAVLSSQARWADLGREIKSHQPLVNKLKSRARILAPIGYAIDATSILTARGTRERTTAVGAAAGGIIGLEAGAKGGAAIGLMVGGPVGAIIGAGIGGAVGATIGGALGKKIANSAVGRGLAKGVNAVGDTVKGGVKKVWKKLF